MTEHDFRMKMAELNFFDLVIYDDRITVTYVIFSYDKNQYNHVIFAFDIENGKICLYDERYYNSHIKIPFYCIQHAFKYIDEFLKGE